MVKMFAIFSFSNRKVCLLICGEEQCFHQGLSGNMFLIKEFASTSSRRSTVQTTQNNLCNKGISLDGNKCKAKYLCH